jgi:hypothetical protein
MMQLFLKKQKRRNVFLTHRKIVLVKIIKETKEKKHILDA